MRVETTTRTLYKFSELSEKAKDNAVSRLYDLNVNHEWWEFTYEDAKTLGLKITEFDLDRGSYCKLHFELSPLNVASKIIAEHGDKSGTYLAAKDYLITTRGLDDDSEEHDTQSRAFRQALSEEYLSILRNEYEYLTSRESIIESIEANEYEFTEDGKLA